MYCIKRLNENMYYVGASDRRLALFENVYPLSNGVSYNSYLLTDEKTVLLDTVDKSVSTQFFENIEAALSGRPLDYLIVNHMEPDHCATMQELVLRYPEVKIITNQKAAEMIRRFFTFDLDSRLITVKEGDTFDTGSRTLSFVMAPMVHWPEVMVTYDHLTKTLFSADAFGTFGALSGNITDEELDYQRDFGDEARRYYVNIVGKYGVQVQTLLKKAQSLEIETVCPLHGPVIRRNIGWFVDKYQHWSSYTPEENAVLIAYASVYGNTENAAQLIAARLAENGVHNIKTYDVSVTHPSYIVAEAFRCSHIVLASTTYNAGIFVNMETLLNDLKAHNLQNRTVAIVENGSWAPTAGSLMRKLLESCKDITVLENTLTLRSSLKESQLDELYKLADSLCDAMPKPQTTDPQAGAVDEKAMFSLSYGLYVVSSADGGKHGGCIVNTVTQLTASPITVGVCVNKQNHTAELIRRSGALNISVLTTDAPFKLIKHFGFQSGKDVDKFDESSDDYGRSANGLFYLKRHTNAFLSAVVTKQIDLGTHILFVADVTETQSLGDDDSMTYQYYFDNVKPKPPVSDEKKKGFICKICGYVYEGDTLPPDFICPLCKHPASDFEPLK